MKLSNKGSTCRHFTSASNDGRQSIGWIRQDHAIKFLVDYNIRKKWQMSGSGFSKGENFNTATNTISLLNMQRLPHFFAPPPLLPRSLFVSIREPTWVKIMVLHQAPGHRPNHAREMVFCSAYYSTSWISPTKGMARRIPFSIQLPGKSQFYHFWRRQF